MPFRMLVESYLEKFITQKINPEIGIDAKALDTFSLSDFTKTAIILKENNLKNTIHGPFIDLSPGSTDSLIRKATKTRLEQLLKLIPVFNPVSIVCHAGYESQKNSFFREEWVENSLKLWKWFEKIVSEEGSKLLLEIVYEHEPEDILFLFENLDPDITGFCLDIGHQSVFGRVPLEKWISVLGKYLGQIHLHDNMGEKDDHLAAGSGKINFKPLFLFLKNNYNPSRVITLEPHLEEDLEPSLLFVKNNHKYLF